LAAGASIPGGRAYRATDEISHRAVTDKVPIHDFHASLLFLRGIDHDLIGQANRHAFFIEHLQ